MPESFQRLLEVHGLVSGYGKKQVLNGVNIAIMPGEIVALIGHNGAGKSTLLKTVFGLLPAWKGHMTLDGRRLDSPVPRQLLGLGVCYAPQGNRVFTDLTVQGRIWS